jgi:DNA-binding MarR family transcriptional regulator
MSELNPIIHQPVRLQIMAALCQLKFKARVDFSYLMDPLGLTDGNLGAHLLTLEEAGFIAVEKTFAGRRPKTFLAATPAGRTAFTAHERALQYIFHPPPPHHN